MDETDLTVAESKATYEEIKDYVLEHSGLKVSNYFVSEVKKINTDRLIYEFSEISIEMFKNNQCMRKVEISVIHYGKR